MARIPRRDLIESAEVGVDHCVQRAVRRAWLCGQDPLTGKNFAHRKVWIQERFAFLAGQFAAGRADSPAAEAARRRLQGVSHSRAAFA